MDAEGFLEAEQQHGSENRPQLVRPVRTFETWAEAHPDREQDIGDMNQMDDEEDNRNNYDNNADDEDQVVDDEGKEKNNDDKKRVMTSWRVAWARTRPRRSMMSLIQRTWRRAGQAEACHHHQ